MYYYSEKSDNSKLKEVRDKDKEKDKTIQKQSKIYVKYKNIYFIIIVHSLNNLLGMLAALLLI